MIEPCGFEDECTEDCLECMYYYNEEAPVLEYEEDLYMRACEYMDLIIEQDS